MIFPNIVQITQLLSWFLALGELILVMYFLTINTKHRINRYAAASLFILALNSFANSIPITSSNFAVPLSIILASTNPIIAPATMHTFIAIIEPDWLRKKGIWLKILLFAVTGLPLILTISDFLLGTNLWYTGLPETFAKESVDFFQYVNGSLSTIIRSVNMYAFSVISLFTALYMALKAKTKATKQLSWIYFGTLLTFVVGEITLRTPLPSEALPATITTFIMASGIITVAIKKMRIEKVHLRGKVQLRTTALTLGAAFLILTSIVLIIGTQTSTAFVRSANNQLRKSNEALSLSAYHWVENSRKALEEIVTNPSITSMDPDKQKPLLEMAVAMHSDWYLVSTTDINGINVARSDDATPKDYSDRPWVQSALTGQYLTYQTLMGRTSGKPALVMSMPIRDNKGNIVGVGMFASDLAILSNQVSATKLGQTGYSFIVDANGIVLAHPDYAVISELQDLSEYPPVTVIQNRTHGNSGSLTFIDDDGQEWLAYINVFPNSWGVVTQQTKAEALAEAQKISGLAAISIILALILMSVAVSLTLRQSLRPLLELTQTAHAIAEGELERSAEIVSSDEIGHLAQTFNAMTRRLREMITSLEAQVSERTHTLEQRSRQLQAASEVSRAASAILDTTQLTQEVTELIRKHFNLYYVGLFLVDKDAQWAILQAGTGSAGEAMLSRGHRIRVGDGMVGWSITHNQARVALIAEGDAFRLATEELPDTRSEAAIPLRARGEVIGALTVQDSQPGAFDQTTIAALQTMADQVGVAIANARLFTESQEALDTTRRAYGEISLQAWQELSLGRQSIRGYRSTPKDNLPTGEELPPQILRTLHKGESVTIESGDRVTLFLPISVRNNVIGVINSHKLLESGSWTTEEINILEALAEQLGQALESARLYEDTQRKAEQEQMASKITTRMRESLNMDTILQTAISEIREAMNLHDVTVKLEDITDLSHAQTVVTKIEEE